MRQILPLRGSIKHYDWGSRTALAELLGLDLPSERPQAELWLGAHPLGPAEVLWEGAWERLDAVIERTGLAVLGSDVVAAFGVRLPFLLKVLAVERPLSLQVHPDAEQARAGFAREQERPGGALLYADPYGKPELVCALTRFSALCGFLPLEEVRSRLARFGLAAHLEERGDAHSVLGGFLRWWLGASSAARDAALARAVAVAEAAPEDPVSACIVSLAREHPGDPGVLAPCLLHRIELAPGEAIFLPPGELHCYLEGVAVELMASSDNVVRGGLTRKVVDVEEMLQIARLESRRPRVLRAEPSQPGLGVWRTPASEFELSLLAPGSQDAVAIDARQGAEVIWCVEGTLRVLGADGALLALARGEGCLVPAAAGSYRVAGSGRAFRAGLPATPDHPPDRR